MKSSLTARYRTLFILVATFIVLCLSPLADIHLEGSSETKSFAHDQRHNETIFAMFLHEVLFTQLRHTLDNVFPGISYPSVKTYKSVPLKGKLSTSFSQAICCFNLQTITPPLLINTATLCDDKKAFVTFYREYSGLSPPLV
jgi:hypothetical protein